MGRDLAVGVAGRCDFQLRTHHQRVRELRGARPVEPLVRLDVPGGLVEAVKLAEDASGERITLHAPVPADCATLCDALQTAAPTPP